MLNQILVFKVLGTLLAFKLHLLKSLDNKPVWLECTVLLSALRTCRISFEPLAQTLVTIQLVASLTLFWINYDTKTDRAFKMFI